MAQMNQRDSRLTLIDSFNGAFARDELEMALRRHWSAHLLQLITAGPNPRQLKYDQAKIRSVLLEPVEAFIAGTTSQVEEKFASLKKDDLPTFLCNRSFRAGEPTYSCRDCAVDSTCVLCNECFKQSAHKNHRYKISSSNGGGYCDCGDPEAWKKDHACQQHQPPADLKDVNFNLEDARSRIPKDLSKRFMSVIKHALCYVYQVLTFREGTILTEDLLCCPPIDDQYPYVTILYNDEVHTYDGVINTLSLTLECTQDDSLEYATVVDHEGRTPVKFGSAAECDRVKKFVERNSKRPQPLRLDVVQTSIYSHQVFALYVMRWIQDLADACEGFKALVCDVCLQVSPVTSDLQIVSAFLLEDVRLWKAARKACHTLFMALFLTFNDAKIEFSRLLACLYPQLMTAFISDDHDHSDSCTSLTVQLFTVPTVARTLFADGLVEVILRSFVLICQSRRNDQGRLSFERSAQPATSTQFKRALYTLHDARYLLNTVPAGDQWNDALRKGFIGTFEQFVQIMGMMEGMDSHTRRTQSHVEYETDWEPAFNMQLRMGSIIDLLQQWCAADDRVLGVCVEKLLVAGVNALGSLDKMERKEVARNSVECIEYDVGSQVVSIHHPVIRLLAGLVVFGLSRKLIVEPFGTRMGLEDCLKHRARELLELPLRTMVLVAQASAGMWRRNGYALANQIFFYQQPRCREEMLDKDIVMMQACAAVMPADSFLIALLNKFGLVSWADETFDATPVRAEDDSIRQVMFLAEEFLYGLIVLIGERFYPNVGRVTHQDCLKNEVIHQLCKESMSYSELLKYLPDQDTKSSQLDDLVKEVALFKKASATSKAIFELKAQFTSRYNMFFYHYTRIEHSKAEDTQKKRRKKAGEDVVFAPPCPPQFTDAFSNIIHLLDSDVFIHLLNLTVRRALISHPRSFSEGQLMRMLYLLGYGLHEEKRQRTLARSDLKFIEKAEDAGVFMTLRELTTRSDNETCKALMDWVLRFYEDLRKEEKMDMTDELPVVERPLGGVADSPGDEDLEEKKRRASARRERIMQQMKSAQSSFASQNMGELKEIALPEDLLAERLSHVESPQKETIVAVGAGRNVYHVTEDTEEKHTCILCSESHCVNLKSEAFVAVAYVQRSTVLSQKNRKQFAANFIEQPASSIKNLCERLLGDQSKAFFMMDTLPCAPHVSSCGHLLHSKCWKTYFDSVVAKERRRSIRLRTNNGSFDVTKNEFRCPLCSRLCNAAIPFCPMQLAHKELADSADVMVKPNDVISGLCTLLKIVPERDRETALASLEHFSPAHLQRTIRSNLRGSLGDPLMRLLRQAIATSERLQGIDVKNGEIVSPSYAEATRTFENQVYQMTMNALTVSDESSCVSLNWSACSYSIQSIEMCLRAEKKSLLGSFSSRQFLCLRSLIRATCWSSAAYEPKILMDYAVRLYSTIFGGEIVFSTELSTVFQMDALALLVNLTCAFPWLPWTEDSLMAASNDVLMCRPPAGDVFDHSLLAIVYVLHVLQCLASLPQSNDVVLSADKLAEQGDWRMAYSLFHGGAVAPPDLEQRVRHAVWPFLRSAALFYHFITGIAAPESLKKPNQSVVDEYEDLMAYLALPLNFTDLLANNPSLGAMGAQWLLFMEALVNKKQTHLSRHPRPCPQLAPLPQEFIDIINRASQYSGCKVEADERRSPALCLICGELLCSQSMCCQFKLENAQTVGACTYHAMTCGGGTGIFLRVRENQILMLHGSNKGCLAASPYVDAYGEPDPFLRRGNPLHLSQERMDQLLQHYLHHDVADEVSHQMDQNGALAGFDWFHF